VQTERAEVVEKRRGNRPNSPHRRLILCIQNSDAGVAVAEALVTTNAIWQKAVEALRAYV